MTEALKEIELDKLKQKYPIEILRALYLILEFKKKRDGKSATPTAYNLFEMAKRNYQPHVINKWLAAAHKRGLVYQTGWYLNSMTYEFTAEGHLIAVDLHKLDFVV